MLTEMLATCKHLLFHTNTFPRILCLPLGKPAPNIPVGMRNAEKENGKNKIITLILQEITCIHKIRIKCYEKETVIENKKELSDTKMTVGITRAGYIELKK